MNRLPIFLALLLVAMPVGAEVQYHMCELEQLRHDGYAKEISATVQVQDGAIVEVSVESTLVAPERGLTGAYCEFKSEKQYLPMSPQEKVAVLQVVANPTGKSTFRLTSSKNSFKIDLKGISLVNCKPQGLWPKTVTVTKGRKHCHIQN